MSLYGMLATRGPSGFGYASTAEDVTEGLALDGRTFLITGSNSGVGWETLRVLGLRGARVIGTARTLDKAKDACARAGGQTVPLACDLTDPASVRACVAAVKAAGFKLDAVIGNAGVMALPKLERIHGYEAQFFTNHIGHFMLVTGLIDQLTERGRVVMLSSTAHRRAPSAGIEFDNLDGTKGYNGWTAYGQSKLANLLFAKQLARRFRGTERTANAVHPGVIRTNLQRHMPAGMSLAMALLGPLFLKTVQQGAATETYVATHPQLAGVSGEFFADSNIAKPRPDAESEELAVRLWNVSERIVAELGS
jgi:NAD(P)-dependent dehydrogenase (short-subunit alcohol dehydrogenase family)